MSKHFSKNAMIFALIAMAGGAGVAIATEGDSVTQIAPIPPLPISCEIDTRIEQGAFVIEAKVATLTPSMGRFSFQVSGGANGNNSQIRQGGTFETSTQEQVTIGRIRLGANNANYDLNLSVESELGTDNCDLKLGL